MSLVPQRFRDWIEKHFSDSTYRFLFVGGATAAIYFTCVYSFLTLGFASWLAALFAYWISFVVGYTAHKFFTFQSTSRHAVSLLRYALLQSFCAIAAATSAIGAETLYQGRPILVGLITTGFLGLVSHFISSKWVFSK